MTIELKRDDDSYSVSNIAWCLYLNVAMKYGWIPIGTKPPIGWMLSNGEWLGNYDSSDGQLMIDGDCGSLSIALMKYMEDPSRMVNRVAICNEISCKSGCPIIVSDEDDELIVTGLIELIRAGGIRIW